MKELKDGWYLVELHQFYREDDSDPHYFVDFIELIDGVWDLGEYEGRCEFSKVMKCEKLNK